MSVIVKGMEMPERCGACFLRGNCKQRIYMEQRPKNCPLTELPPHGRLIDADKFAETLKKVSIRQGYDKLFSDNILSVGDVFNAIATDLKGEGWDKYKLAPTVIEAEGETE